MFDLNQFQRDAMRTESKIDAVYTDKENVLAALLAAIAAATLLDHVKKSVFYSKPIPPEARASAISKLQHAITALNQTNINNDRQPVSVNPRIFHHIIGIITEGGELAEQLFKQMITKPPVVDEVNIAEECGDLNWYVACLLDEIGANFGGTLDKVIAKLRLRYPDKFDSDKAINRNLDAERDLLEK